MTHKMSSFLISTLSWQRSHFSVLCGFGFVVVLCVLLVCLVVLFVVWFDGTAHWTVYRSITNALLRLSSF